MNLLKAIASVVNLTFLYSVLRTVIPAKAGIQIEKTGFRIKSGMTKNVKSYLNQYIRLPFQMNYRLAFSSLFCQ
jgi:hypothetical protein